MVGINCRLQKVYKYCSFSSMTHVNALTTCDGEVEQETLLNFKLPGQTLATQYLPRTRKYLTSW